jgi:hypothetical protein
VDGGVEGLDTATEHLRGAGDGGDIPAILSAPELYITLSFQYTCTRQLTRRGNQPHGSS